MSKYKYDHIAEIAKDNFDYIVQGSNPPTTVSFGNYGISLVDSNDKQLAFKRKNAFQNFFGRKTVHSDKYLEIYVYFEPISIYGNQDPESKKKINLI